MKKLFLLITILWFLVSCMVNEKVGKPVIQIPAAETGFRETGRIKPRPASEIRASYLGVGCEVLCRGYAYYDAYKEYLGQLGVKHARFQSGWAKTEKEPGYYDFTWLDPVIDDCISRGIRPWINISYGNPLYPEGGDATIRSHIPQGDSALYAWDAYVRNLVNHYKTRIFQWEVWNEPNNHHDKKTGPILYADFFIRTAEIIREVQPEGKTVALAIGYYALDFTKAFFDHLKSQGKVHLVDVACMHGYPANPDDPKLDKFIQLVKEYDDRITFLQGEAGAPSQKTTGAMANAITQFTEMTQAKWDLRRTLMHVGRGIPHSQFSISDMKYPGWETRGVNAKGLLKINEADKFIERPKEAYYAYQNLTSLFDSTVVASDKFRIEFKSDSVSSFYPFIDLQNGKPVVAYWHSGNLPGNSLKTEKGVLQLHDVTLNSPVLVDIRTGIVYRIPASAISKHGPFTEFTLPVYDSPMIICEKKFLRTRGVLSH